MYALSGHWCLPSLQGEICKSPKSVSQKMKDSVLMPASFKNTTDHLFTAGVRGAEPSDRGGRHFSFQYYKSVFPMSTKVILFLAGRDSGDHPVWYRKDEGLGAHACFV
jgi:hypothetical protein